MIKYLTILWSNQLLCCSKECVFLLWKSSERARCTIGVCKQLEASSDYLRSFKCSGFFCSRISHQIFARVSSPCVFPFNKWTRPTARRCVWSGFLPSFNNMYMRPIPFPTQLNLPQSSSDGSEDCNACELQRKRREFGKLMDGYTHRFFPPFGCLNLPVRTNEGSRWQSQHSAYRLYFAVMIILSTNTSLLQSSCVSGLLPCPNTHPRATSCPTYCPSIEHIHCHLLWVIAADWKLHFPTHLCLLYNTCTLFARLGGILPIFNGQNCPLWVHLRSLNYRKYIHCSRLRFILFGRDQKDRSWELLWTL